MRFDDGDELELDKDKESIEMKKTHRTIQDFLWFLKILPIISYLS